MGRPSDREYALHRKIRELEEQNRKKDLEIQQLKKKLEKGQPIFVAKGKQKNKEKGCPTCGAAISTTDLPFGKLYICKEACGWRRVENGND